MTTTVDGLAELGGMAGTDLGCTGWTRMSTELVRAYAVATDNAGSTQHDDSAGDGGPYGFAVVDGFHTMALAGTLFDRLLKVNGIRMNVIYGVNRIRFPAPLPIGSPVRLRATLAAADRLDDGCVQVIADCAVELYESAKPACVAQIVYRFYA